jgi:hypothetical protein
MARNPEIIEPIDESFGDEVHPHKYEISTGTDLVQGADLGDDHSSLTSLSSSLMRGVEENGRTYAGYGQQG